MTGAEIEYHLKDYLRRLALKEVAIPTEHIDTLVEEIRERLYSDLEDVGDNEFTFRMSSIGKPLCQVQMEAEGKPRELVGAFEMPVKFITGDMLEAWLLAVIKSTELPVNGIAIPVELMIAGKRICGTADIIIGGKVYDIKTASDYSFKKYGKDGGFMSVYEDDPFGYVVQGFLYARALGLPFGGWIVVNKNKGDIAVCEAPLRQQKYSDEVLDKAEKAVYTVVDSHPFVRGFDDIVETFRKKETGNRILCFNCEWCSYRSECWGELTYHPAAFSQAKNRKWHYYTELNKVREDDPQE
ncbi:MAG TPA: hypothetical protein DHN29_16015 [Cytophagales bacterium]|nr:hypothetical protein [Cytophagales bacterium]|tara:strand:+ start:444 stop:1337 length:894 start_codon:yes stop_codon:yes gene_type:complete